MKFPPQMLKGLSKLKLFYCDFGIDLKVKIQLQYLFLSRCPSGKALHWQPRGTGFEPRFRHRFGHGQHG